MQAYYKPYVYYFYCQNSVVYFMFQFASLSYIFLIYTMDMWEKVKMDRETVKEGQTYPLYRSPCKLSINKRYSSEQLIQILNYEQEKQFTVFVMQQDQSMLTIRCTATPFLPCSKRKGQFLENERCQKRKRKKWYERQQENIKEQKKIKQTEIDNQTKKMSQEECECTESFEKLEDNQSQEDGMKEENRKLQKKQRKQEKIRQKERERKLRSEKQKRIEHQKTEKYEKPCYQYHLKFEIKKAQNIFDSLIRETAAEAKEVQDQYQLISTNGEHSKQCITSKSTPEFLESKYNFRMEYNLSKIRSKKDQIATKMVTLQQQQKILTSNGYLEQFTKHQHFGYNIAFSGLPIKSNFYSSHIREKLKKEWDNLVSLIRSEHDIPLTSKQKQESKLHKSKSKFTLGQNKQQASILLNDDALNDDSSDSDYKPQTE